MWAVSIPLLIAGVSGQYAGRSDTLCVTGGCPPSAIKAPHVVVDRQEIAKVIREKTCPDGMTLEGDTCVGEDICPTNYVCPRGTVAQGDRCVTIANPMAECPPGYEMANGKCTVCDIAPAEYICHDPASSLDHTGVACSRSIEQAPHCPHGYVMEHQECVQKIPAQSTCPPGYSMSGDGCVRSSTVPAAPVCPDGSTLVDNARCSIVRQDPPHCPRGYKFDAGLNTCVQPASRIPAPCPHGYSRVGSNCERTDRHPAEAFCPPEYTLDYNNQCVREIPVPPRCPTGHKFSSMDSSTCERSVSQLPVCPDGQKLIGGKCENIVEHPSIECCPPGFELFDGRCRRVEQLAPQLTCENECYRTTTTKVAYACPDDAEFVDHPTSPKCIRRELTYCPSLPASYRRCMSEAREGRSLQGCPSVQTIRTVASACAPQNPTETLPAQAFCPEGGVLEGNRCVLREPIIPERKCRVGHLDEVTGQCIREVFVPVKSDCPPGTVRRGSSCVTIEHNAPDYVCPPGADRAHHGGCVVTQASISSAPQVSRIAPSYRCHTGQLCNRDCSETTRMPMEMVCPLGTTDNAGGCVKTAELITPAPVERFVRPAYVCHEGGVLVGTQCSLTDRIPVDKVCPTGTSMDYHSNNICIRTQNMIINPPRVINSAARPVCPPGMHLKGSNCVATRSAEILKICSAGYDLEGSRCVRQLEKVAVCPAGTELNYNGCVRRISIPAKVRIVQGCAHDVVAACDTCPRTVTSSCH